MQIEIANRRIGGNTPCFVIAEAGVNHNGDVLLALKLVDAALEAGADAVKFQTFLPEALASELAPKAAYQRRAADDGESQLEMLRRLALDEAAFATLKAHCEKRAIMFLSTPFDAKSADVLDRLGVPGFKISSGDLTDLPFLRHVASKSKPMLVSTGMATLDEVGAAVSAVGEAGAPPLALLHCVSSYPAEPADANLRAMATLARAFDLPVGYSDHTTGTETALAAAALGAAVIEKHLTLARDMDGPDHGASTEPGEFAAMVRAIRNVEAALGDGEKAPRACELPIAQAARKSVTATRDIRAGETITAEMICIRRPGTGLAPAAFDTVLGRRASHDIGAGVPLSAEMID